MKKSLRTAILTRDLGKCGWCRQSFEEGNLDVHHLVPQVIGGPDEEWNLISLCRDHHLLMNLAFRLHTFKEWWDAGDETSLGKCFSFGLKTTSLTVKKLPPHLEEAINDAGYLFFLLNSDVQTSGSPQES